MDHHKKIDPAALRIGYLMQTGAPDMNTLSGPQLHISATVDQLKKLGHQVRTVAIQNRKIVWSDDLQNWYMPQFGLSRTRGFSLVENGIRKLQHDLQLPFLGLFDSFRYADACYHLLKGYDILYERHGWMGYGSVIAARWLGIPLVEELNGNHIKQFELQELELSATQWKLSKWITYRTFHAADHIVVVSEALKTQLEMDLGMSTEKVSVVLNGANLDLFAKSYDGERVREQYNIRSSALITFVGSFQIWHGVDLLVSSFMKVLSEFPGVQLILIGDGERRNAIESQIASLGIEENVKLLGRLSQKQVARVLHISNIAVAPYPFEDTGIVGTPLKLIEYMAAGKAIVASTAPIHEVISDGVTGLRVTPANTETLARGICCLLEDQELQARLGANAHHQAQNYSWESVARELNNILVQKTSGQSEGRNEAIDAN
jgi:glycosyltransferase involved in cell wall biosynthesis